MGILCIRLNVLCLSPLEATLSLSKAVSGLSEAGSDLTETGSGLSEAAPVLFQTTFWVIMIWNIARNVRVREKKFGPGSCSELILFELKRSSLYDGMKLYCFRNLSDP